MRYNYSKWYNENNSDERSDTIMKQRKKIYNLKKYFKVQKNG